MISSTLINVINQVEFSQVNRLIRFSQVRSREAKQGYRTKIHQSMKNKSVSNSN
jgi:hypothetical protein